MKVNEEGMFIAVAPSVPNRMPCIFACLRHLEDARWLLPARWRPRLAWCALPAMGSRLCSLRVPLVTVPVVEDPLGGYVLLEVLSPELGGQPIPMRPWPINEDHPPQVAVNCYPRKVEERS